MEKTLITHARTERANFLGYELHTLDADDKHDNRGQRCINGAIGLRVPKRTIGTYCRRYMRNGKPVHHTQRVNDTAYSIVVQYQAEFVGYVQYYRLAYNLHQMSQLKWVMETSLTKTLAKKLKMSVSAVYDQFRGEHEEGGYMYKVLKVVINRGPDKPPLTARFGGVPLRWNTWVAIRDTVEPIWSGRSEVVQRLLKTTCEVCGAPATLEAHHIRKLADIQKGGRRDKPKWMQIMIARRRKTLMICQKCHNAMHYGRYDGPALST